MASTNSGATSANNGGLTPVNNSGATPLNAFLMNQDVPSLFPMTNFLIQITKKLDDKNFLLWQQQIKPAITALGLNRFVASPQIPPRYLSDEDHDPDRINPLFSIWQK